MRCDIKFNFENALVSEVFRASCLIGKFEELAEAMLEKKGIVYDYIGCLFPDENSYEEEKFDGVIFLCGEEETLLSEQECFMWLSKAMDLYVQYYPEEENRMKKRLEENMSKFVK